MNPFAIASLILAVLSPQAWNISQLSARDGLSSSYVTKIIQSSDGYLFFGTQLGVDRFDGREIIPIALPESNPDMLSVRDLTEDNLGRIWIISDAGICRLNPGEFKATVQTPLGGKSAKRMVGGGDGKYIFFVCKDSSMTSLDVRTEKIREEAEGVLFMCSDFSNRIFYNDVSGNLNLLSVSTGDIQRIQVSNAEELSSCGIQTLPDGQPDWRLGIRLRSSGNSLFVAAKDYTIIIDLSTFRAVRKEFARMYDVVTPPYAAEMYVATRGISVLDGKYNEIGSYCNDGTCLLKDNFTNTACADREGGIWVGTRYQGVYHFSKNFSGLHIVDYYSALGLTGAHTKAFYWRGDGGVEVCTASYGTFWYSLDDGVIARDAGRAGPDLAAKNIILDDGSRFHLSSEALFKIEDGCERRINTPSGRICALLPGKDGSDIWFASLTAGLWRMDVRTESFERVNVFNDRDGCSVSGITFDGGGNLWGVADRGIFRVDTTDCTVRVLTEIDGFPTNGFTGAISCLPDGRVYIGLLNGFLHFNPKRFAGRFGANRILFTDIQRLGSGQFEPYPKEPVLTSHITLPYESNSFSLGVSDLSFATPSISALQYRMPGVMDKWADVSGGRITMANLPHGRYRLEVRQNPSYPVSGSISSLDIKILRHPLASILAFVIYFSLIVVVVTSIVIYVRKKDREKQLVEDERRAAKNEKDMYASKVDFLSGVAAGIGAPLTLVKALSESLEARFSKSPDSALASEISTMSRNIDTISSMIGDFARIGRNDEQYGQKNLAECDVTEIVLSVFNRFSLAARTKGLTSECNVPDSHITASVDKKMLEKILSNLLSNAVRYSSSSFSLTLSIAEGNIKIEEQNDGKPIPENLREKIFEPFYRINSSSDSNASLSGLGLHIARSLAAEMDGTLAMDGDMTTNRFVLTLPVVHISNIIQDKSKPTLAKPTVKPLAMIAESNADLLKHLETQFENAFFVVAVRNGDAALEYLRSGNNRIPDIVICDIFLQKVNGMDICREIKSGQRTCHIPVILTTPDDSGSSQTLSDNCGADMLLVKPYTMERLFSAINNLLEGRKRLKDHYRLSSLTTFDRVPTSAGSTLVRNLDDYLANNIGRESLSVEELASSVNMSASNLQKRLKALVGVGPLEYINDFRMNRAAQMLENDSLSILDVSMATGFSAQTYFTKVFKKHFGMTPREYRSRTVK